MPGTDRPTWLRRVWIALGVACVAAAVGCSEDPVTMSPGGARDASQGAAGRSGEAPHAKPKPIEAGMLEDEDAGAPSISDAGGPAEFAPPCDPVTNIWMLAPGFLLAKPVEYVADRSIVFGDERDAMGQIVGRFAMNQVASSAGTPCATASDRERCLAALEVPPPTVSGVYHLVTTVGDTVTIWQAPIAAQALLGLIDTPAEVIWWLRSQRGAVPCSVRIEQDTDGYAVYGAEDLMGAAMGRVVQCYEPDGAVSNAIPKVRPNGDIVSVWPDGSVCAQ